MASLGWVTSGAATEGVTPLFFSEKPSDLFLVASSAVSPLISSDDLFCSSLYRFLLLSLGCHLFEGVTLHRFYLSNLVSPLFFLNLPTNIFPSGVTPWRVSPRGGLPPSPPPSDATGWEEQSRKTTHTVGWWYYRLMNSRARDAT